MNGSKCKCEWCELPSKIKGYCERHYYQDSRYGGVKRTFLDKNEIIINKENAEIILYDRYGVEKARTIIDINDVDKCKDIKWCIDSKGRVGNSSYKDTWLSLHRYLLNAPKDKHVDHINRNPLDNRKCNLRLCSIQENNRNKGLSKNNKTGKTGVYLRNSKYIVKLKYNKKENHIGTFDTLEKAIKAREDAELKFYGYLLDK